MSRTNRKIRKSRLTASRKPEAQTTRPDRRRREAAGVADKAAPARGQSKPDWLDGGDKIRHCCRTVEMLGHLMEGQSDEPLAAEAVREAGSTLVEQVKQVREALTDLEAAR